MNSEQTRESRSAFGVWRSAFGVCRGVRRTRLALRADGTYRTDGTNRMTHRSYRSYKSHSVAARVRGILYHRPATPTLLAERRTPNAERQTPNALIRAERAGYR